MAVTPLFRLIFITVCAITVITLVMNFILARTLPEKPTQTDLDLVSNLAKAWTGGIAAIFGLMAGKAT